MAWAHKSQRITHLTMVGIELMTPDYVASTYHRPLLSIQVDYFILKTKCEVTTYLVDLVMNFYKDSKSR